MTAMTRRGLRIATAVVVSMLLLGIAGCGGESEGPDTAGLAVPQEADQTEQSADLEDGDAAAEAGALEAVPSAGAVCRAPGPLPGDASNALERAHSAVVDLAGSADAVRALAASGGAPSSWPDDPGDSLILRRFLEDLYRVVERTTDLSSDPEADELLAETLQAVLILQARDLPLLYRAGSAREASGPVDAICGVVDRFASAIEAIAGTGTPSTTTTEVPSATTTSSSISTTEVPSTTTTSTSTTVAP